MLAGLREVLDFLHIVLTLYSVEHSVVMNYICKLHYISHILYLFY